MQSQYSSCHYKVNEAGDYFNVNIQGNKIDLEFWTNNEYLYGISYVLNEEKINIFKKKSDFANEYDHFEKSFQPSCKTLTDVIKRIDEHKDKLFSEDEKDIKQAINSLHNMHFNAKKDDEKKRPIIQNTINTGNNSPNKDIQKKKTIIMAPVVKRNLHMKLNLTMLA